MSEANLEGSSLVKVKSGKLRMSVERSDSPDGPTEIVIKRTISPKKLKGKHARKRSLSQPGMMTRV